MYAWVRFAKPANVLEIGAGYTSMFLLRALEDNAAEIEAYRALRAEGACRCRAGPRGLRRGVAARRGVF